MLLGVPDIGKIAWKSDKNIQPKHILCLTHAQFMFFMMVWCKLGSGMQSRGNLVKLEYSISVSVS